MAEPWYQNRSQRAGGRGKMARVSMVSNAGERYSEADPHKTGTGGYWTAEGGRSQCRVNTVLM